MHYVTMTTKSGGSLLIRIPIDIVNELKLEPKQAMLIEVKGRKLEIKSISDIMDNMDKIDNNRHKYNE